MIRCEVDYRRALEQLQRYGEALPYEKDPEKIQRIERCQHLLMDEICDWILRRPRSPGICDGFFGLLRMIEEDRCKKGPRRTNRGNRTNHPSAPHRGYVRGGHR